MAANRGLGGSGISKLGLEQLGQGEDALFQMNVPSWAADKNEESISAGFTYLPLESIIPNPGQPRKEFEEQPLNELAQSIEKHGLINPIVVSKDDDKYIIIAGERRYRACKLLNLEKVPVSIMDLSKRQQFEMAVSENIHREDLNPVEEAIAYQSLIETYGETHEQVAESLGKSRAYITNSLRLLNLAADIQHWLIQGDLTPGHARTILSVADKNEHISFARYIIDNNLSVREAEKASKIWPKQKEKSGNKKEQRHQDVEIKIAEEKVASKLQAKVAINGNSQKGKIQIEYFSMEELEGLLEKFGVDMSC